MSIFLGPLWYIGPLGSKRDPKRTVLPRKLSDFVQPARDLMKQSWELSYLGSRSDWWLVSMSRAHVCFMVSLNHSCWQQSQSVAAYMYQEVHVMSNGLKISCLSPGPVRQQVSTGQLPQPSLTVPCSCFLAPKKCQRFQWKVLSSHASTCQWFPGIWSVQQDWQLVVGLSVGVEHVGPHLVVLVVQQLDLLFSLLTFLSQDFWGPSGVQTPSYPPPRRKSVPKRTCFKHILR